MNIKYTEPNKVANHSVSFTDTTSVEVSEIRKLCKTLPGKPVLKNIPSGVVIEFWSSNFNAISQSLQYIKDSFPNSIVNY